MEKEKKEKKVTKKRKVNKETDDGSIQKLTSDIKDASRILSKQEARYLVDSYYVMQEQRKRTENQLRALVESGEPSSVIDWFADNATRLEARVKDALDAYSAGNPVGIWARNIQGIGPVISAGLLAHIDITKCTTVGSLWRFAGLDPSREWLSAEKAKEIFAQCNGNISSIESVLKIPSGKIYSIAKYLREVAKKSSEKPYTKDEIIKAMTVRPYNERLKTLCWKIGESFVKVSGKEDSLYGRLYRERKELEEKKNENGDYKEQALSKAPKVSDKTESHKTYSEGKLTPGHIQSRAKRYAVKMFLSHLFEVMYLNEYGKKYENAPYAIAHLGHVHKISVEEAE